MRRPGLLQWLMVLPVQSLVIAVIALPSLWVLWLSLNEATYGQANVFVGLDNYAALLGDRYFWRAFVNTFVVVNVIVYVELALGARASPRCSRPASRGGRWCSRSC